MAASVRGTHQSRKSLAPVGDLVRQHALQHTGRPQSAAVMKVHVQHTDAVVLQYFCTQHPRAVCAAICFGPLEHHAMSSAVMNRAVHSEPFAARKRPHPGAQLHVPGRVAGTRWLDAMQEIHPQRVLRQVVDIREQLIGTARSVERRMDIHGCSIAGR